jgi:hypothetical protein
MEKNLIIRLFLGLSCIGLAVTPVAAYLDPGTGSMLLQVLIAVLMGMGITIKIYWQKVKDFFINRK